VQDFSQQRPFGEAQEARLVNHALIHRSWGKLGRRRGMCDYCAFNRVLHNFNTCILLVVSQVLFEYKHSSELFDVGFIRDPRCRHRLRHVDVCNLVCLRALDIDQQF
jgi:hypothetical protein